MLVLDHWSPGDRCTYTIPARWCILRSPRMHPAGCIRSHRCSRVLDPFDSLLGICTRNYPPCSRIQHPFHTVYSPHTRLYLLAMVNPYLLRVSINLWFINRVIYENSFNRLINIYNITCINLILIITILIYLHKFCSSSF